MPERRWKAKVRPEYVWPYPRLDLEIWYPIRPGDGADPAAAEWLWLATLPSPTYVYREHFHFAEVAEEDAFNRASAPAAQPRVVRQARLRPAFAGAYEHIRLGVWYRASDLLPAPGAAGGTDRRLARLSPEHFDFRDAVE